MKSLSIRHNFRNSGRGFSLLELIVVLVILGLLASVVGPRVTKWTSKGKVEVAKIQVNQFREAIETFRLDIGRYPTTGEGLKGLTENTGMTGWDGPYLSKPFVPKDPWGREYHYLSPGEHADYDLWSCGADGLQGGEGENVDVTSWGE